MAERGSTESDGLSASLLLRGLVVVCSTSNGVKSLRVCRRGGHFGCSAFRLCSCMIRAEEGNDHAGEDDHGDEFERVVVFHVM